MVRYMVLMKVTDSRIMTKSRLSGPAGLNFSGEGV